MPSKLNASEMLWVVLSILVAGTFGFRQFVPRNIKFDASFQLRSASSQLPVRSMLTSRRNGVTIWNLHRRGSMLLNAASDTTNSGFGGNYTSQTVNQFTRNNNMTPRQFVPRSNRSTDQPTETQRRARFPFGPIRDSRFASENANMFEISFLGTASCIPTMNRGVSCTALRYEGDTWLFDCGESTQLQFTKSSLRVAGVRKIFITHTHGDHFFGLPGMLCMLGQGFLDDRCNALLNSGEEAPAPIDIYGPEGCRAAIRVIMQLTHSKVTAPYRVHELKNVPFLHERYCRKPEVNNITASFTTRYGEQEGGRDIFPDENGVYTLCENEPLSVQAAPMQHTVPCVGYVVQEPFRLGALKVEKARALVLSNSAALAKLPENKNDAFRTFKTLKNLGQDEKFTFPDGTVVTGKDMSEPGRRGRKVVIMGDTCSGRLIKSIAQDADVLVHEATNAYFPELEKGLPFEKFEKDVVAHGHSTPEMAGRFAASIRARRLFLTHFSTRYSGDSSEQSMNIMWQIEDMARKASHLQRDNDVVAAWDGLTMYVRDEEDENKSEKKQQKSSQRANNKGGMVSL